MSTIQPTIGRKVWYFGGDGNVREPLQAFDATVVYVHPSPDRVNLLVVDHAGQTFVREFVELRDPTPGDSHYSSGFFATWMPYQVGQARAAGA